MHSSMLYFKDFNIFFSVSEDQPPQIVKAPLVESPVRTLAAKKYFDEPLDISIQRKAIENTDDEPRAPHERYHPYSRPQEGPINLQVQRKLNYTDHQSHVSKVQDQPVDFSKKRAEPRLISVDTFKRHYQFQRNLLVILLQNINRNPAHGKNIVKYLKTSCEKVKSRGCSGGKNGTPNQGGGHGQSGNQAGGGGGSGGGYNSSGPSNNSSNSTGGSPHSSRSSSTDEGNNLFDVSETDFDNIDFDFNESATRKWITDNSDLSPLKVLDHISFKPDPAPDQHHQDQPKPPDLSTLDRDTASILQLAVPVPDPSSTFLDIGTDFGPVSFYEDDPFNLEQLVPSTFNLNNVNNMNNSNNSSSAHHQPLYPVHHQNNNSHHQQQQHQPTILNLNNSSNVILQQHNNSRHQAPQHHSQHQQQAKLTQLEMTSPINFTSFLPDNNINNITRHAVDNQNQNQMKYAVKTEPPPPPQQQQHCCYPQIKEEVPMGYHGDGVYPSPASPSPQQSGAGGKMRTSPQRKKSTSSSNDEEDLLNVPSLQMRIQILQQRVRKFV